MPDPRDAQLAKILTHYSTKVKPKDKVAILGTPLATPLITEVFREVLKAGAYPYPFTRSSNNTLSGLPGLDYIFLTEANDDQLAHIDEVMKVVAKDFDVLIKIYSDYNTHNLSTVDPSKGVIRSRAHMELNKEASERFSSGEARWVVSMYPTEAYAQDADMSLQEFQDFVYATTYSDTDDPVAAWNAIHDEQQKLVDWLNGKKQLTFKGPNVDLSLSVEGRTFINSDGKNNMPSGEIFTSPVEDAVNGWVRFTYPAIRQGREVEGVELKFEKGKVVEASAEKNQDFLISMLDTDKGARYLGEFAIGTNKRINRFIKNILFDEKIGGTIHMALGFGFAEVGGKNESAIHWDLICDMRDGGQIFADGELFYESGEFKI